MTTLNTQYREQPPLAAEIDRLRAENEALKAGLEWAIERVHVDMLTPVQRVKYQDARAALSAQKGE